MIGEHVTVTKRGDMYDDRGVESDLSVAQANFLHLHAQHIVERWRWHFLETQLRAHAGNRSATIWRDELNDLVSRGLMEYGVGFAMRVTDKGKERVGV